MTRSHALSVSPAPHTAVPHIVAFLLVFLALATPVRAGIVAAGGAVQIISPPATVVTGKLESDSVIPVFVEREAVALPQDITANITQPGTYDRSNSALSPAIIAGGTLVNTYLIHFDKVGGDDTKVGAEGSITFSEEILGLLAVSDVLKGTHLTLGATGTAYPNGNAQDVEFRTRDAYITLSPDLRTLSFNIVVTCCSDNIRVLTAVTAPQDDHSQPPAGQTNPTDFGGLGTRPALCGLSGSGSFMLLPLFFAAMPLARRRGRKGIVPAPAPK